MTSPISEDYRQMGLLWQPLPEMPAHLQTIPIPYTNEYRDLKQQIKDVDRGVNLLQEQIDWVSNSVTMQAEALEASIKLAEEIDAKYDRMEKKIKEGKTTFRLREGVNIAYENIYAMMLISKVQIFALFIFLGDSKQFVYKKIENATDETVEKTKKAAIFIFLISSSALILMHSRVFHKE